MNDTKHTPGCWRVGDAGHTVFGPPNGTPSPETIANVRKRSNARLISAAPELLDALQTIVNLSSHPYFPELPDLPAWKERITQARTAIAKAEGR
jgi:hypothetical protein